MSPEPLLQWPDPILELLGFIALFLTVGAVGYRLLVLPALRRSSLADEREVAEVSSRRAVWFALAGAALSLALFAWRVPQMETERHLGLVALFARDPMLQIQGGLRLVALAGFGLAAFRPTWGWPLAALGVMVGLLRSALFGQWARLINPMHALAGGLWIGTLFFVLAAGLPAAMSPARPADRREAIAAQLIRAFSPLALVSAATLVLFGVVTAWRHLKHPVALWTTPYGITLLVKLSVVAAVFALGAWNWRRVKPRLGSEGGALALRKSARAEVLAAGLVLVITAVLVSLPSP